MSIYQIICLVMAVLGLPSIGSILVWTHKKVDKQHEKTESIKKGLQALLRSQMINDYNRWLEKGFAPIYARDSFENCWSQYHNLGANGVMNDIHDKFTRLPTSPPEKNTDVN